MTLRVHSSSRQCLKARRSLKSIGIDSLIEGMKRSWTAGEVELLSRYRKRNPGLRRPCTVAFQIVQDCARSEDRGALVVFLPSMYVTWDSKNKLTPLII